MSRNSYLLFLSFCLLLASPSVQAQSVSDEDSTGLPGDNFSLQGALEMFKKSKSPEDFEKLLNTEGNDVNNLDLNNDGEIDYIKVIDKKDGDTHAFILQVPISSTEDQDIAVIELEKTSEGNAVLQIVGDEDIFGEETIVEPSSESESVGYTSMNDMVGHGPFVADGISGTNGLVVNVWMWPSVRFIYGPSYVLWASPWRWRAYPGWYRPWRPVSYHVFYPRRVYYHPRYVVVHTHRVVRANAIYRPVRTRSVTVVTRNNVAVNNYRRTTTTRKTVHASNGNRQVRATKTTRTTVRKRHR